MLNAADSGCSAAIIFTDPDDVAPEGDEGLYPDGLYLPGDGMQVKTCHFPRTFPKKKEFILKEGRGDG